jgi:hypothetical protein
MTHSSYQHIPYTFHVHGRFVSFDKFFFSCNIGKKDRFHDHPRIVIALEEVHATVDAYNCTATKVVLAAHQFDDAMKSCNISGDRLIRKHIDKCTHTLYARKNNRDMLYGFMNAYKRKFRCWQELRPDPFEVLLLKSKAQAYYKILESIRSS